MSSEKTGHVFTQIRKSYGQCLKFPNLFCVHSHKNTHEKMRVIAVRYLLLLVVLLNFSFMVCSTSGQLCDLRKFVENRNWSAVNQLYERNPDLILLHGDFRVLYAMLTYYCRNRRMKDAQTVFYRLQQKNMIHSNSIPPNQHKRLKDNKTVNHETNKDLLSKIPKITMCDHNKYDLTRMHFNSLNLQQCQIEKHRKAREYQKILAFKIKELWNEKQYENIIICSKNLNWDTDFFIKDLKILSEIITKSYLLTNKEEIWLNWLSENIDWKKHSLIIETILYILCDWGKYTAKQGLEIYLKQKPEIKNIFKFRKLAIQLCFEIGDINKAIQILKMNIDFNGELSQFMKQQFYHFINKTAKIKYLKGVKRERSMSNELF